MKLRGEVFSGAMRGAQLIEKHSARLIGLVGFRPFPGTLDVRLERNFDIAPYATKRIEHQLVHTKSVNIDAYLLQVTIRKVPKSYTGMGLQDRENDLVKDVNELISLAKKEEFAPGYECWAIQFAGNLNEPGTLELIARDSLRKKMGLEDGDKIEIDIKVDKDAFENNVRRRR